MKELSIEEKAKAYDKALAIARNFYNSTEYAKSHAEVKATYEAIFPELKEGEDDRIRKSLIGHLKECRNNTRSEVMIGEYAKWIAWLEKQGEQKPAWSEEDERMLDIILNDINYAQKNFSSSKLTPYARKVDWFKSLKERVQPKQEWSEEDNDILNRCISLMSYNDAAKEETDWLKSLKDRYTWKPSEEQMKVLDEVIRNPHLSTAEYNGLIALKEQLKAQKGE